MDYFPYSNPDFSQKLQQQQQQKPPPSQQQQTNNPYRQRQVLPDQRQDHPSFTFQNYSTSSQCSRAENTRDAVHVQASTEDHNILYGQNGNTNRRDNNHRNSSTTVTAAATNSPIEKALRSLPQPGQVLLYLQQQSRKQKQSADVGDNTGFVPTWWKQSIDQLTKLLPVKEAGRTENSDQHIVEWTFSSAFSLGQWFLRTFMTVVSSTREKKMKAKEERHNHAVDNSTLPTVLQLAASSLGLLSTAIENWEDSLVYAVVLQSNNDDADDDDNANNKTLLQVLKECVFLQNYFENITDASSPSSLDFEFLNAVSLRCWMAVVQSLDRVHWYATSTVVPGVSSRHILRHDGCDMVWWWERPLYIQNNSQDNDGEKDKVPASTFVDSNISYWKPVAEWALKSLTNVGNNKLMRDYEKTMPPEEIAMATASFLVHYIHHAGVDWMSSDSHAALVQYVLVEAERLTDPNLPEHVSTIFSLTCLHLLSHLLLHQHQENICDDIASGFRDWMPSMVQHVIQATFGSAFAATSPTSMMERPVWATSAKIRLSELTLNILRTWSELSIQNPVFNGYYNGSNVARTAPGRQCIQEAWESLLSDTPSQYQNDTKLGQILTHLLFWYHDCRLEARQILTRVLEEQATTAPLQQEHQNIKQNADKLDSSSQRILTILVQYIRQTEGSTSLVAVTLLRLLLDDRRNVSKHDRLSRSLWKAVDYDFVHVCINLIPRATLPSSTPTVAASTSEHYYRPKVLGLLDVLETIFSCEPSLRRTTVEAMETETVEAFIKILETDNKKTEDSLMMSMEHEDNAYLANDSDSEQSTPTANNLSRIEVDNDGINDTDIGDYERRNGLEATLFKRHNFKGLDSALCVAAACVLALLGNCPAVELAQRSNIERCQQQSRLALLQGHMSSAVQAFVSRMKLSLFMPTLSSQNTETRCNGGIVGSFLSFDMTKRRLRLLMALVSGCDAENEEFLTGLIYASESFQRKEFCSLDQNNRSLNHDLKASHQQKQQLEAENQAHKNKLASQAALFQREKHQMQRYLSQNARKLIQVHQSERSHAESDFREMSKRLQSAEEKVAEADCLVLSSREAEAKIRDGLVQATSRLEQLEAKEQDMIVRIREREQELSRLQLELKSTKESLSSMVEQQEELHERIDEQDRIRGTLEQSQTHLRDNLESLFADMSSLAQIYAKKEQEEASSCENSEALVQKLKRKLEKEKERNAEFQERYRQVQYENEMLSTKYAKVREKLTNERKERQIQEQEAAERQRRREKRNGPVSYINQLHNQAAAAETSKSVVTNRKGSEKENHDSQTHSLSRRSLRSSGRRRK